MSKEIKILNFINKLKENKSCCKGFIIEHWLDLEKQDINDCDYHNYCYNSEYYLKYDDIDNLFTVRNGQYILIKEYNIDDLIKWLNKCYKINIYECNTCEYPSFIGDIYHDYKI